MVDSIHTFRWLTRFNACTEVKIEIFPSSKFRKVNNELQKLLNSNPKNFQILKFNIPTKIYPYLFFIFQRLKIDRILIRSLIKEKKYDYIHLLEFQHAGYLFYESLGDAKLASQIIVTNWGSDISFFSKIKYHEIKIRNVLRIANFYSSECVRDLDLARKYGFVGKFLPVVTNSFLPNKETRDEELSSNRKMVLVKGYGGTFGLAEIFVDVLEHNITDYLQYTYVFYSVTKDIKKRLLELKKKFPQNIIIYTAKEKLSEEFMFELFLSSRIYIGLSRSDGISTSFLEAIQSGTYAIQSNTSCASEFTAKGIIADIIEPNYESVSESFKNSVNNVTKLDNAQRINQKILPTILNKEMLISNSIKFYGL